MSDKKEIWLIGYAHLDTQWRWEYPTTIKKYIKNTLDQNLVLFEKYPEFKFNFTGMLRYAMMKEYYPEKFEKAKKYIKEGRWCLSGTCLDETDTLSPSVESMIRNMLYGDKWAQNEFGKTSRDYMIPDCFGFPANMPSVLAHCGIQGFSTQKLTWGSSVGIPFEIGIWKGPDNEGIVCALNPGNYTHHMIPPLHKDKKRIASLYKLGEKNGIWKAFQYYGVGDIGGAPTKNSVRRALSSIEHAHEIDPNLVIILGSSDQFFKEVTNEEKAKMDTYSGDLLLINHSAGSLSSAAIMKRWNRKNEQIAFAGEAAALSAFLFAGARYPNEKIKSAWYRTIGNQMHDILPGTCTPLAYEYSQNDEVVSMKTWSAILNDAAEAIAPFVPGTGDLLVFNPLGEKRSDIVDIEVSNSIQDSIGSKSINIKDAQGKFYAAQITNDETGRIILSFIPTLEPISWTRFSIDSQQSFNSNPNVRITKTNDGYTLENQNLRLSVSNHGIINSLLLKTMNKEALKSPLAYEFQKETPSAYPAWNMDWADRKNPPYLRIEDGIVSIVEEGPLRCTLKIVKQLNASILTKYISLSDNSEVINFTEKIHWREQGCAMKFSLTPNMNDPTVTFNWETSRAARGVNTEKLFEMPSRYWANMVEDSWGISIIEDSKYGYDRPKEDTLRLTMLYTPSVNKVVSFRDQAWQDWGEHTIRYGLYVYQINVNSRETENNAKSATESPFQKTDYYAHLLNQRVRPYIIQQDHSKAVKTPISLFKIEDDSIGVLAVKKAEEENGFVLRVYDRIGKNHESKITLYSDLLSVRQVNGLEETLKDIPYTKNSFTISLKANGIASYLIIPKEIYPPTKVAQIPLNLKKDISLLGNQKDHQGIFPSELIPNSIYSGEITLEVNPNSNPNAMLANGQTIAIPQGFNKVYLLVVSCNDANFTFKWVNEDNQIVSEESKYIPSMKGYIGQWDARIWKFKPLHKYFNLRDYLWLNKCVGIKSGFIKSGRLEFYTTHTHKNGKDLPYQYGYLITVSVVKPKGATRLVLPSINTLPNKKDGLFILAATAADKSVQMESAFVSVDTYEL